LPGAQRGIGEIAHPPRNRQRLDALLELLGSLAIGTESLVSGKHLRRGTKETLVPINDRCGQLAVGRSMFVGLVVGDELVLGLAEQDRVAKL
jgi:hypothetical protein